MRKMTKAEFLDYMHAGGRVSVNVKTNAGGTKPIGCDAFVDDEPVDIVEASDDEQETIH